MSTEPNAKILIEFVVIDSIQKYFKKLLITSRKRHLTFHKDDGSNSLKIYTEMIFYIFSNIYL